MQMADQMVALKEAVMMVYEWVAMWAAWRV